MEKYCLVKSVNISTVSDSSSSSSSYYYYWFARTRTNNVDFEPITHLNNFLLLVGFCFVEHSHILGLWNCFCYPYDLYLFAFCIARSFEFKHSGMQNNSHLWRHNCVALLLSSVSKSSLSCTDESSKDETVLSADWEFIYTYIHIYIYI